VVIAGLYFLFLFMVSYIAFTLIIFNHFGLFLVYYLNAQEFCRGLDDFSFYDSFLGNGWIDFHYWLSKAINLMTEVYRGGDINDPKYLIKQIFRIQQALTYQYYYSLSYPVASITAPQIKKLEILGALQFVYFYQTLLLYTSENINYMIVNPEPGGFNVAAGLASGFIDIFQKNLNIFPAPTAPHFMNDLQLIREFARAV
jgi:hypothetical protein